MSRSPIKKSRPAIRRCCLGNADAERDSSTIAQGIQLRENSDDPRCLDNPIIAQMGV